MENKPSVQESDIFAISRPAPALMTYYFLSSLLLGPLFFFPLIPLYFRYHTLRYSFDSEGISMRWGILFRREINLTYARIQDIHLRSNLVQRWLGLARVEVQTASGSAGAEMVLEGLLEYEAIRDYVYGRMRGGHGAGASSVPSAQTVGGGVVLDAETTSRLIETLEGVTVEIRELRGTLERRAGEADG
ncbi:MAG: PH domain-containing protein [Acidobacteriota bacterium]